MKGLVAAMIAATAASGGLAQTDPNEWVPVATTGSGTVWKLRANDMVNTTNQHPTVWVVADHSSDKKIVHRETKQLFRFDCANRGYRSLKTVQYWADGTVRDQWTGSAYRDEFAPPDSMVEAALIAACPKG
jgi:hypothetical protein